MYLLQTAFGFLTLSIHSQSSFYQEICNISYMSLNMNVLLEIAWVRGHFLCFNFVFYLPLNFVRRLHNRMVVSNEVNG